MRLVLRDMAWGVAILSCPRSALQKARTRSARCRFADRPAHRTLQQGAPASPPTQDGHRLARSGGHRAARPAGYAAHWAAPSSPCTGTYPRARIVRVHSPVSPDGDGYSCASRLAHSLPQAGSRHGHACRDEEGGLAGIGHDLSPVALSRFPSDAELTVHRRCLAERPSCA